MGKYKAVVFITFCVVTSAVIASEPSTWDKQKKDIIDACISKSDLNQVHAFSDISILDDSVGYSVLLLQGTDNLSHMPERISHEVCLFHRRLGTVFVSNIEVN